jgi:Flp pilus assembly protein TadD
MHDKCWDVNPVWLDRGQAAAECAIQLDARAPEGYKSLAVIQLYRGDRPGACISLRRAIEAKLDYLPAHVNLAAVLRADGDLAGAERSLRRALQIDPAQPFVPWALAHLLVFTRRYSEAIALCDSFEGAGSPYYYVRGSCLARVRAGVSGRDRGRRGVAGRAHRGCVGELRARRR